MDDNNNIQEYRELPQYRCHKVVRALKIKAINGILGGAFLIPEEKGCKHIKVSNVYIGKHNPIKGGYYVLYEDGYESFSPAKAFEKGYVLIPTSGVSTPSNPKDKETFIRFADLLRRKLNQKDFEKVYGTILPIADTIPGFDDLPDFNH